MTPRGLGTKGRDAHEEAHLREPDHSGRFGHWFGTDPQFWLNLQSAYEIRIAEQRAGAAIARLPVRRETAGIGTP